MIYGFMGIIMCTGIWTYGHMRGHNNYISAEADGTRNEGTRGARPGRAPCRGQLRGSGALIALRLQRGRLWSRRLSRQLPFRKGAFTGVFAGSRFSEQTPPQAIHSPGSHLSRQAPLRCAQWFGRSPGGCCDQNWARGYVTQKLSNDCSHRQSILSLGCVITSRS